MYAIHFLTKKMGCVYYLKNRIEQTHNRAGNEGYYPTKPSIHWAQSAGLELEVLPKKSAKEEEYMQVSWLDFQGWRKYQEGGQKIPVGTPLRRRRGIGTPKCRNSFLLVACVCVYFHLPLSKWMVSPQMLLNICAFEGPPPSSMCEEMCLVDVPSFLLLMISWTLLLVDCVVYINLIK